MGGGKGGGSAPSPDPNIGIAARENAALGKEYLNFAQIQHGDYMIRQGQMDALTAEVVSQQMQIASEQLGLSKSQFDLANRVSQEQMKIAREQQALAREVAQKQMAMSDKQLEIATQQQDWAIEDRDRYKNVFQPIEDEFIQEATSYGSVENQSARAAEALADVRRQADISREQTQRQMASMGIDPRSGRYAAIDRGMELETALASAGAQNSARVQVRDKGLALKADVANLGRGLPAQSAQATALGLQAGNSSAGNAAGAVGTMGAGVGAMQGVGSGYGQASNTLSQAGSSLGAALGAQGMANQGFLAGQNIMGQGYNQAMQGFSNQANILNSQYQNQLSGWAAQQQANAAGTSGLFGAIGTGLGLAFSSKDFKEDRKQAKDALDKLNKLPVDEYQYKKGIADEGKHIGTMAEDFKEVTGRGDGKTILNQDAIGLTMKAVQELDDKVEAIADGMGIKPKKQGKKTKGKKNG